MAVPPQEIAARSRDYEQHAKNVYHVQPENRPVATGWTYVTSIPENLLHDPCGLDAAVYETNNEVVLAFAGTDPRSGRDWWTDIQQGIGFIPQQYYLALRLAEAMRTRYRQALVVVGHSLGGGLASYTGLKTMKPFTSRFSARTGIWQYNAAALAAGCVRQIEEHHGPNFREGALGVVIGINVRGEVLSNILLPGINAQPVIRRIKIFGFGIHFPIFGGQFGTVYFVWPRRHFRFFGAPIPIGLHFMDSLIEAMNRLRSSR